MNLGLESLNISRTVPTIDAGLAFGRTLDSYITMSNLFNDVERGLDVVMHLNSIRSTIRHYGCTESLLSLYGDNNITFSVEGVGDKLRGAWEWIKKQLKKLWEVVSGFFKRLFSASEAAKNDAKNVQTEIKNAISQGKVASGTALKLAVTGKMANDYAKLTADMGSAVGRFQTATKLIEKFMATTPGPEAGDYASLKDFADQQDELATRLKELKEQLGTPTEEQATVAELQKRCTTVEQTLAKAERIKKPIVTELARYNRDGGFNVGGAQKVITKAANGKSIDTQIDAAKANKELENVKAGIAGMRKASENCGVLTYIGIEAVRNLKRSWKAIEYGKKKAELAKINGTNNEEKK